MVLWVLDPALLTHGKPVELLFAADVEIGTLVPADWIAPGSIHPVPRLIFRIGLGLKIRICNIAPFPNYWISPIFRILFPFLGFCSLSVFSASFPPSVFDGRYSCDYCFHD